MARFEAEHQVSLSIPVPPAAARDHFGDLDVIVACSSGVDRAERPGGGAVRFFMKPQNHGFARFEGRYTCVYRFPDDRTLAWETPEGDGNMGSSGEATFTAEGGGTRVDYVERVWMEMEVPGPMAGMLRPVISKVLAAEVAAYVKRVRAGLP
jgi:carbon monoxide dehydrogenase subunit G